MAKAGELSLSRLFADRYVKEGVLVNARLPGRGRGRDVARAGRPARSAVERTGAADREDGAAPSSAPARPNGRFATAEEVAAAIVFLCSERASYVAGAAWSVDAGTVQVII